MVHDFRAAMPELGRPLTPASEAFFHATRLQICGHSVRATILEQGDTFKSSAVICDVSPGEFNSMVEPGLVSAGCLHTHPSVHTHIFCDSALLWKSLGFSKT
jgi:hypothetical protein